ncbi:GIN domain-containing protein [Maribacter sp. 4G9]|uniref:GIN domain-containing protein n=1 Tax=Maribacter sp. 4G9 TaxID=1889777 RepID=UPI000C15E079|nr:DUF2807 domain-containing protein [Maribacter sp. 4G9]PIB39156.1 hypothetical protein BFP75_12975 [Maribacter sp. 4G9]
MKKYIGFALLGILLISCNTINKKEIRELEEFYKVNLVGNIELHLIKGSKHSIEVMSKNFSDNSNLRTEVRNGELYISNKKECGFCKNPKYIIYLNHSGISNLILTGTISLSSDDKINQKDLVISGVGVISGNLKVSVNNLKFDFNGISNLTVSGYADTSNLKINGIGIINTANLETNRNKKVSEGISLIYK